jgi:hypothetical protein
MRTYLSKTHQECSIYINLAVEQVGSIEHTVNMVRRVLKNDIAVGAAFVERSTYVRGVVRTVPRISSVGDQGDNEEEQALV